MHLEVTFKNLRPREEVRRRAQALWTKLERFLDPASEGVLVVTIEHANGLADLTVRANGETHQVQEEDADLRTALDRAFHRIESSLRRAKEKRVDRWHRGIDKTDGFVADALAPEDDELTAPAAAVVVPGT